jgi:hypothetical protein
LNDLLGFYGLEGMAMPYTMEDYKRDAAERLLNELTPEQRMKGLRPEELLAQLSREQHMHGLSPEQLLSLLPLAEIENYVKKQKADRDKAAPESPETPS